MHWLSLPTYMWSQDSMWIAPPLPLSAISPRVTQVSKLTSFNLTMHSNEVFPNHESPPGNLFWSQCLLDIKVHDSLMFWASRHFLWIRTCCSYDYMTTIAVPGNMKSTTMSSCKVFPVFTFKQMQHVVHHGGWWHRRQACHSIAAKCENASLNICQQGTEEEKRPLNIGVTALFQWWFSFSCITRSRQRCYNIGMQGCALPSCSSCRKCSNAKYNA